MTMLKKGFLSLAAIAVMTGVVGCGDDTIVTGGGNNGGNGGDDLEYTDTLWGMPAIHPDGWTTTFLKEGTECKVEVTGEKDKDAEVTLIRDKVEGWPFAILHGTLGKVNGDNIDGSMEKLGKVIIGYKLAEGDTMIMGFHDGYTADYGVDSGYAYFGVKIAGGNPTGDYLYDTIDVKDIKKWSSVDSASASDQHLSEFSAISFRSANEEGYDDAKGSYGSIDTLKFTLHELNFIGKEGLKADLFKND